MIENEQVEKLWNFNMQTEHVFQVTETDTILLSSTRKKANNTLLVAVTVSGDHNIMLKEIDNLMRYTDLRIRVARIGGVQVTMIPIVTVEFGSMPQKLVLH